LTGEKVITNASFVLSLHQSTLTVYNGVLHNNVVIQKKKKKKTVSCDRTFSIHNIFQLLQPQALTQKSTTKTKIERESMLLSHGYYLFNNKKINHSI